MRTYYDEKLNGLERQVCSMADLNMQSSGAVCRYLKEQQTGLAADMKDNCIQIEQLYAQMDREILLLLMREQPVASDLHRIAMLQGVSLDCRRIGQQLAELARLADPGLDAKSRAVIVPLAEQAEIMLEQAASCLAQHSVSEAEKAIAEDERADSLFEAVRIWLSQQNSPVSQEQAADLLLSAKYLERICDHAEAAARKVFRFCKPEQTF